MQEGNGIRYENHLHNLNFGEFVISYKIPGIDIFKEFK